MKCFCIVFLASILVFANTFALASLQNTRIMYELEEFGQGRWESVYHVENLGLTGPIEQFTIWFDYGLYSDLTIETPPPLNTNWDEETYNPYEQPPLVPFDGYYDALVQQGAGVASGELVKGFSVSL